MTSTIRTPDSSTVSSPTMRNPHFSSTRMEPMLWFTTCAWSGRVSTSVRNSVSARVATPLPQYSRPIQ